MDGSPIRHARAADGTRIAYRTMGSGPPIVVLFPLHVSHVDLIWRVAAHREGLQQLARRFTVVNLDLRGSGLSERDIPALSFRGFDADLRAVLDELRIPRAAFCAMGAASLPACHFAISEPARVTALVFLNAGDSELNRRLLELRQLSRDLETGTRGALISGPDDAQGAATLAAAARAALDPQSLRQWQRMMHLSVVGMANRVSAPALCLQAADDSLLPRDTACRLAADMLRARPQLVRCRTGMQIWRSTQALTAIERFVADSFRCKPGRRIRVRRARAVTPEALTHREMQVLRLVATGRTNKQIATELKISLNTVAFHMRQVLAKTAASNRTEAAAFAIRRGVD